MRPRNGWCVLVLCGGLATFGCADDPSAPADPRRPTADRLVRARWGAGLDDLPTARLVVISPHNEDIVNEFEWAFSLDHAVRHGQKVAVEWRDVGGGSTAVLRYLRNVYARSGTADIDLVWGGGEVNFVKMASEGILQPMQLPEDVLANIPESFGGLVMCDEGRRWCGSAVSGFGFLYNVRSLEWAGIPPPRQWEDLGRPECFDQICLADPTQSGSAAAAYEMIVQSAPTWPEGWARLLAILGNGKRFVDSASGAANAPVVGEAALAACIDFYGILRVAEAPDVLAYVSPKGQTTFNPDPIAILRNPPHPELAQRFVDFVLSRRGQALWALRVGQPDGPIRYPLGRQPIRRDVYEAYADGILPRIVNPYEAAAGMKLDTEMWDLRFGVLRELVRAAAVDNREFLKAARRKLIDTGFEPARLDEFNRLPDDVATREGIAGVARRLRDKTEAERITTAWQRFFREKYRRVAE